MMNKIINKENGVFWVVGIVSILVMTLGIVFMVNTSTPAGVSEDEKRLAINSNQEKFFGEEDAEIVITEYFDFQCSHCAEFHLIQKELRGRYGDRVKFVMKYFPLNLVNTQRFSNGLIAADAAEAARAQDKFAEMHDIIFENQQEWSDLTRAKAIEKFEGYAKEIGVADMEEFEKELNNSAYREGIERDFAEAQKLGLVGTPTVFVNFDQQLDLTLGAMTQAIEAELAAINE